MVNAIKRVTIVMLDSLGVGEQPDAKDFGQFGHNTIRTVATQDGGISLPHFQALGLGNLTEIPGVPPNPIARAAYGRMQEQAAGVKSRLKWATRSRPNWSKESVTIGCSSCGLDDEYMASCGIVS